jgi:release factor glutamine methyltransferase
VTGIARMDNAATVRSLLEPAARRLAQAGIDAAPREARLLLALVLGCQATRLAIEPNHQVTADEVAAYREVLARRCAREPFSHIAGTREFWGLEFRVGPAVLDPRPDSETLVEAVLARFPDHDAPLRVLDLGTGSGCLLLAVLSEYRRATGIGVDISEAALRIARDNASRLGSAARTRFVCSDWDAGLTRRYDLVLCNPPYIARGVIDTLAPEVVRFEPRLALDGGPDGLDAYRLLAPVLARRLGDGGAALVELGQGQHVEVKGIFEEVGLVAEAPAADLAGIARCLPVRLAGILHDHKKKVGNAAEPI